jgi:hypothetical protein
VTATSNANTCPRPAEVTISVVSAKQRFVVLVPSRSSMRRSDAPEALNTSTPPDPGVQAQMLPAASRASPSGLALAVVQRIPSEEGRPWRSVKRSIAQSCVQAR